MRPEFDTNFDLENLHTPVQGSLLVSMLKKANYNPQEISFLEEGFANGFDIGYKGPTDRQSTSQNIPLRVGNATELWNKLIKEIRLKRVAGPYDRIPFNNFIQSPIGLVPKAGGQTRLIFHLSYEFGIEKHQWSVNKSTPHELCSVQYEDIDCAVKTCVKVKQLKMKNHCSLYFCSDEEGNEYIFIGKTDIKSAFRLLLLNRRSWRWTVMKARNPMTGDWQFFIDKCLPFGASISYSHFQRFSNALKFLIQHRTAMNTINNYLDDFLFVAVTVLLCNYLISQFLELCEQLGVPISMEKTEWAATKMIFLGILLNGVTMTLVIPEEKRIRAVNLINSILSKRNATVKEIQTLCGFLNFLNRAIVPGRTFTRRMYAKFSKVNDLSQSGLFKNKRRESHANKLGKKTGHSQFILKPYHHVRIDQEFRLDSRVWLAFLNDKEIGRVVNRSMMDMVHNTSEEIMFYSDASRAKTLGFGCIYKKNWIFGQWPPGFIKDDEPSIEYLELFAMAAGILTWQKSLSNMKITVFCDNQAVMHMINNNTSSCSHCMKLIRLIVLNNLLYNRKLSVKFVSTQDNGVADALSRLDFNRFRRLAPEMKQFPDTIDERIWPIDRVW